MNDLIHQHALVRPGATALWAASRRWTYAELDAAVADTEGRLSEAGVERGDRIALHVDRTPNAVILLWAVWRRGAVAVPLSTRLPPGEIGPRALQVDSAYLVTATQEGEVDASDQIDILSPQAVVAGRGTRETSAGEAPDHDRPASIVFTSGSTGTPKAALHTWANHLYSAKGANANLPLEREDRWLLSLPLYHVGGLAILVRCALAGAAVAIPPARTSIAANLRAAHATHVSLVATQFRRVLDAIDGAPPASLKAVLLGGGPIPDGLLRDGYGRSWPLLTSYGSTEMASQITTTAPGAPLDDLQTAGRTLPHRRVRIEDEQIYVAGPTLFRGYVPLEGPEAPQTDDGWYPTGDRGRIDASGRLRVLGRMDRMFVSGGENIQPEEIEAVLERLDVVERAAVVPVPHAEYGRRPVAFVHTTEPVDETGLQRVLTSTLPGYKIPDGFYKLPAKVLTQGLKINRERLRERARTVHDDAL